MANTGATISGVGGEADAVEQARAVIDGAVQAGIPLRLIGGLAIRLLTPEFPPREREGQDLDLASVSSARSGLSRYLSDQGFVPDKEFNNLYGHKQMYFVFPGSDRALDVVMDQLNMCHVLDFRTRIERMPHTLDVADLLLSKLQIVELNEKDVQDLVYLLAAFPVTQGDEPGTIGLDRVGKVLGEDWGWWRTVTANLDRVATLAGGEARHLVPPNPPYDPVAQARTLREHADRAPKTLKWKLRAKVGDRMRWYELPEEVAHH
jgi:hypothetical protein